MSDDSISLNKFISSRGMCSRREADRWIGQGLVLLNGETATKGNRVSPGDVVSVNGETIKTKKKTKQVYIMFHKPSGVTCTTDSRDPTNIIDYIKFKQRIFPIGRLDKNSTGLILLTNDGDIVNKILRKENKHEKEYIVTVNRPITIEFIQKMSGRIPILGTKTVPSKMLKLKSTTFKIVLTQGLNRQIRRMCEYCGYKVVNLKRIRIMHLKLGKLKPGHWRLMDQQELDTLLRKIS